MQLLHANCMYVCMHACMYVCIPVRKIPDCSCCMRIVCMYACMHVCIPVRYKPDCSCYMRISRHNLLHWTCILFLRGKISPNSTSLFGCVHEYVCMHVYIHKYIHTYIHTYICIHIFDMNFCRFAQCRIRSCKQTAFEKRKSLRRQEISRYKSCFAQKHVFYDILFWQGDR